jgi:hydroxyacylglutathione hydrolase
VLLVGFPALALGTNCYVVAPGAGGPCLVVDPGVGIEDTLGDVLREHRLEPQAVLLTHGHFDHTYSVTPVCSGSGAAAYIHGDDAYRLTDPLAMMNPQMIAMLEQQFGRKATWQEPDEVRTLTDGEVLHIAGLDITVDHAPGHTEGSVMFRMPHDEVPEICLSGDVLFAGSIGRTDLPGGDHGAMLRSLREKVLSLGDETVVLPGHGPQTTIGQERASNPFLQEAARAAQS